MRVLRANTWWRCLTSSTPSSAWCLHVRFAQEISDRYHNIVDLAVHRPRTDPRNFHAHLLTTTREVSTAGLGPQDDCRAVRFTAIRIGAAKCHAGTCAAARTLGVDGERRLARGRTGCANLACSGQRGDPASRGPNPGCRGWPGRSSVGVATVQWAIASGHSLRSVGRRRQAPPGSRKPVCGNRRRRCAIRRLQTGGRCALNQSAPVCGSSRRALAGGGHLEAAMMRATDRQFASRARAR